LIETLDNKSCFINFYIPLKDLFMAYSLSLLFFMSLSFLLSRFFIFIVFYCLYLCWTLYFNVKKKKPTWFFNHLYGDRKLGKETMRYLFLFFFKKNRWHVVYILLKKKIKDQKHESALANLHAWLFFNWLCGSDLSSPTPPSLFCFLFLIMILF
jgi:hypothetical protein